MEQEIKTKENLEVRVGFRTISLLRDEIKEYLRAHTINGRYFGKLHYLQMLAQFNDYLKN